MKINTKFLTLTGMMAILALFSSVSQAEPPAGGAVMCDKCKMVMVKVPDPTTSKNPTLTYHDSETMVCPDCKSAMTNFFKTGKLKHTCNHCGGTMTVCH